MSEGFVNPDGSFGDLSGAPENLRSMVEAKKYTSVMDIVNAYEGAQKKLGVDPSRLLTIPDKPDGDWGPVYEKLGKPKTADEYDLGKDFKHDLQIDDALLKDFKKFAHEKLHLNNNQFKEIVKFQLDAAKACADQFEAEQVKAAQEARDAADKALREAMKLDTQEKYDAAIKGAQDIANKLGITETLNKRGLGDDPEIIGMLINMSNRIAEGVIPSNNGTPAVSREQKLEDLQKHPAFADPMHPDHVRVIKEWQGLFGMK